MIRFLNKYLCCGCCSRVDNSELEVVLNKSKEVNEDTLILPRPKKPSFDLFEKNEIIFIGNVPLEMQYKSVDLKMIEHKALIKKIVFGPNHCLIQLSCFF